MKSDTSASAHVSILAVSLTTLFWGLSYAATKGLLQSLSPIEIATYRFVIAVAALVILTAATGRLRPLKREHWLRAAAAGLIGVPVYFLFENYGLKFTSASTGSLIIATIPVLNLIVSWLTKAERVTVASAIGVVLSFSGVYLLVSISPNQANESSSLGVLLVFGAAISWVAYTRLNAPLVKEYDLVTLNTIQTCIGTAALIPIGIVSGISLPQPRADILVGLAYLGFLCSAAGYVLYSIAQKGLGSLAVTCFLNFVPVFTVIGAVAFLGESLTFERMLGGLTILAGVALVTLQSHRTHSSPAASHTAAVSH